MTSKLSRRHFVKGSLLGSSAFALSLSAGAEVGGGAPGAAAGAASAGATLPKGKIGQLEIGRLLLGGNLLTHFTHSRELRYVYDLAARYNTKDKIMETMAVAEAHGVDTLVIHTAEGIVQTLRDYREKRGGKIKWIICPTAELDPALAKYREQVRQLVDVGVNAIYLWGVRSDALVQEGNLDLLRKAVDVAKAHNLPSGVGAHALEVVAACEKHRVEPDFYIKTLHHHNYPSARINYDSMWCAHPQETIDLMRNVKKPWIAFKTMAAGAIPPQDAFRYAIEGGADFVLAGMFDFEIAQDVRILSEVLASSPKRARPWLA